MQIVQAEYLDQADPPVQPAFSFLQQGSTGLKGLRPGRWKVNVHKPEAGPQATSGGGEDREVVVKPAEQTKATFEVE